MEEVTAEAVRQHLEKMLASDGFLNSDRLCRFLRFTVEAKLRGEADQIKEYLLGREVFDRNGDYDPRLDPIVRVEARRLRRKLDEYYAGLGRAETIRVLFPKGSYVPEFRNQAAGKTRRWWLLAVPAALGVVLWGVLTNRRPAFDAEAVAVLPAQWVWQNAKQRSDSFEADLAERIAAELASRHGARVVAWPALRRFGVGLWNPSRVASELGVGRILIVAIRTENEGPRLTTFLMDARTDRKLAVFDKAAVVLETAESRRSLSAEAASTLARHLTPRGQSGGG
ncbi:MAG: hypothetical protein HYZ37_00895 [Candidatus Solibacter usitatus]|nr:hypothetical protein [Candidatus Solibacter usitatus]